MVLSLFKVQGVKWCRCFGCCSNDKVRPFPTPSSQQHLDSFTNLNDSRPINDLQSTLKNSNRESKVNDDLILSTDSSYYCCNTIVNDLPYSWPSHSEQAKNQLIRKCIKRWHELSGDIRVDPCILYRPSDSRTSNLIVFKLDRTIVDTKLVAAHPIRSQSIRKYNKCDLVFNQMEYTQHSHRHRLSGMIKKLAIYRKGFMELLHALKSGKVTNKSFDIALYGDTADLNDIIFHAVAIETYFNWHYLRIAEKRIFKMHRDRIQKLQLNFVFAANHIERTSLERYDRVFLVYSEITAGILDLFWQFNRVKVRPFEIKVKDKMCDVLYDLYNERGHEDAAMQWVQDHLMNSDQNVPRDEQGDAHNNTVSPFAIS